MTDVDQSLTLPKNLYLETTNRCNLRCKGCILYNGNWEPDRDISFDELTMITDQLPDLEQIMLHGVGEPLLNLALPQMIRHLKNRNVYTLFNSNGILLDARWQYDLIDAGLDELRISLDAATPKGYRKIRNNSEFNRIVRNLRSFLNLQSSMHVNHPRLSLWFLGTEDNIFELPEFVHLANDIGIGDIYLQRLVYFQDSGGYGVAKSAKSLRNSDGAYLELIQKSHELATRLGIRFEASGLCKPGESIQSETGAESPWMKCYRPSTLMYVTANGNVLPCCIAPFSTIDFASIVLGNVFETPLEQIWRGPKYKTFREKLQSSQPPKCCRGCGILWSL